MVRPLLRSLLCSVIVFGCDSSSDFEDCTYADDPSVAAGSRSKACPDSTFPAEDIHSREVSGVVWRGPDPVPGAIVRIEPWLELTTTRSAPVITAVTDNVGAFTNLRPTALRYDITAKIGTALNEANSDVVVVRGVAARHVEPSLEIATTKLPNAWTSHVDATFDSPIPEGHAVAFFANGDSVLSAVGQMTTTGDASISLVSRKFTGTGTIHAVEYIKDKGLESAVRYGSADVLYTAGSPRLASLAMTPITRTATTTLVVTVPPGFSPPKTVDVIAGYAGSSAAVLTRIEPNVPKTLPLLPNAIYTYHGHITAPDGSESDTGEMTLDAFAVNTAQFPAPPVLATTPSITRTDPLLATGAGVIEHVLVPDSTPSSTIRVIVRQRDARLPDLAALGMPAMQGSYTWTARSYQGLRFVEELTGPDARRYHSAGTAAPRKLMIK